LDRHFATPLVERAPTEPVARARYIADLQAQVRRGGLSVRFRDRPVPYALLSDLGSMES